MKGITRYRSRLTVGRCGRRLGIGGHGEWISGGSFIPGKVLDGGLLYRSWSDGCKRIGLHGGVKVGSAIRLLLLLLLLLNWHWRWRRLGPTIVGLSGWNGGRPLIALLMSGGCDCPFVSSRCSYRGCGAVYVDSDGKDAVFDW